MQVAAGCQAPDAGPGAAAWMRASLDASGDGYMVMRAVREAGALVDWVVVDANAPARLRWRSVVGDVVGVLASRLNAVADNSVFLDVCERALVSGERQEIELQLALPAGRGGWRRVVATPVDADAVSVLTHDITREHYLASELARDRERQRPHAHAASGSSESVKDAAEARFAARTISVMFLVAGLTALTNSVVSRLDGVDVGALRITGLFAVLVAAAVLVLPWRTHFVLLADLVIGGALAILLVSDHFDHYSRSEASVAVYPIFFILVVAWTGLNRPRGFATITACIATPALYLIMSAGAHPAIGLQCVIVTMPVAAVLGEVLSWTSHRARTLTNAEVQRRLHDPLTGLANRTLLSIRLDHALARVRRTPDSLAVLFVDLDHFKHVNDTYGHNAGDDVLIETAMRLQTIARPSDTIARIGGDEFVLLFEDVPGADAAADIAQRLLDVFRTPFPIDADTEVSVTPSIGIAFSVDGAETAESLLQNADLALYRAKGDGRARYEVFGESIREHFATRRELELALREAIPRGELRVHYQPIVQIDSAAIVGFEALLRWDRGGYGLIPPAQFIPIAEETGLITDLGAWVLRQACHDAASWALRWPDRTLGVSVNVSGVQLANSDVVRIVRDTLLNSGLPAARLTLELTESTLIDTSADTEPTLHALRSLGINLAIDDFGIGYSSLTYLRRLPVNFIKIDQSFVRSLGTERQDTAIVAAVINLARNLDLHVVAEGVETPEQLAALVQLNCEYVQGYLFATPQPVENLAALVERAGTWIRTSPTPTEPV
jgi:diguanylate cyclase (GGDEF)-like protein